MSFDDPNVPAAEHEGMIEMLLIALATQAGQASNARFSDGTLDYLAAQDRTTVRTLLGCIGHLVHYGSNEEIEGTDDWLRALFAQLIAALRRAKDGRTGDLLPGDLVEVIVARPQDHFEAGATMMVYCVGEDGTVDVGFESLVDDYIISTVELAHVRRPQG